MGVHKQMVWKIGTSSVQALPYWRTPIAHMVECDESVPDAPW